ncbi:MAG: site-specific integrase [Candidatus Amoebophilus sp.]
MKISIILYKSKTLADGSHPLMVRISQLKARKYFSTGLSCLAQWWDFDKHAPKRNHPDRNLLEAILSKKKAAYHTKLLELESEQKTLSLEQLVQAIEEPKQVSGELLPFLKEVFSNLTQNGKIGRSSLYKRLYTSLKEFTGSKQLCFSDMDVSFLNHYETFLYKQGLSENSISTYFKVLRALLNKAIQSKRMKKEHYPFDNFSLGKFSTLTQKRAMSKEDLKQIINLPLALDSKLQVARDYFLFSYYGRGMNFRDMAALKWKQIIKDRVVYKRLKTGKLMQFQLIAPAMEILERYKKVSAGASDDFVFPILDKTKHLTPQQISYRINNALKEINQSLKELAEQANIPVHLTTYVARHTYATVLKQSGISTGVISEALGHKGEKITEVYLKSFSNEVLDEASNFLL